MASTYAEVSTPAGRSPRRMSLKRTASSTLPTWLRGQTINVDRHLAALRPFRRQEFGSDAAAPTDGHILAVNQMIKKLRSGLVALTRDVDRQTRAALSSPSPQAIARVLTSKERAHTAVRGIEQVWDFYFELFGQRQSQYGDWLLSCDRIALDCYQEAYMGIGVAKSIPAPPAFSYMRTGFSPATFRRGIPLQKLGSQPNPFPLIQLPYHRLVNPWTLGAVLHEVSHNLQNDLGLDRSVPRLIAQKLLDAKLPKEVALIWTRWNRETFADLSGLLLGGPAVVASLMDVVGRAPRTTVAYSPSGPHPTPYLRTFLSIELLRRMGFHAEAESYKKTWTTLYPNPGQGTIPKAVLNTAARAIPVVVDTVCFHPYAGLGGRTLAQVYRFGPKEQEIVEEAARRLAAGTDPGVVPERFLIGAARVAFDNKLAAADVIAGHFYKELARR